jgi:hypothetical protein
MAAIQAKGAAWEKARSWNTRVWDKSKYSTKPTQRSFEQADIEIM